MRLTCSQKHLATALMITNKAVNTNNTLPVLNNVLLKAEGKKLYFTTTDLEIAIDYWIDAEIKNEGAITLPSRLFTNYIGYLKDEKVELSIKDGEEMVIKNSDSTTQLKGVAASDFPSIPPIDQEGGIVLEGQKLIRAIHQVVFAASLNTTRPILSGVYFKVEQGILKMVATDSYRLAETSLQPKKVEGDIFRIIPARTLIELSSILESSKKNGDIEIAFSKNQVVFHVDQIRITSRLIEGKFPDYQQIIPKNNTVFIDFNVPDLTLTLKRINIFAKENNNKVLFKVTKDGVVITTDTTQYGGGEVLLKPHVRGGEGCIALNSHYILDVLGNMQDIAVFALGEKTDPILIRPNKTDDYLYIIMPLKI
jgi:DNA polymerase III subunit beta